MTPEEARQKAAELVADNQLDFTEVVAEWLMLQQKEPEKVKAVFSVDWSLLRATQDSLCEHMAALKAAQESERAFREQVAVALEELRGLINLEFIGDEFSDYNEGLRDALRHVDATIAALGLGEQGGSEMTEQERSHIREQLARRMFPDAVIEDSPTGSGVDIRVYDKPNETRTWYNFDPFRSAEDKDALVKGLAADDDLWNRFTDQLYIEWNRVRLDNDRNVKPNAIEWERFARTAPREIITICAARALGISIDDPPDPA